MQQDPNGRSDPRAGAPRQVRTASAASPRPVRSGPPAPAGMRQPGRDSRPVQGAAVRRPLTQQELEERRRAAARRKRQIRRNRRRFAFAMTAVGVLLVSGIITLLLPPEDQIAEGLPTLPPSAGSTQLVAPLPYNGGDSAATAPAVAVDWGTVGPARQSAPYTYTAVPAAPPATLPASGQVSINWFSDAAFLGDSITAGLQEYNINVSGGLVCGYVGASPNQIVNRTTLKNTERGEEVPLDVLAARAPRKVYILMGTNALRLGGSEESFLGYYGRMLDELRAVLPQADLYVQSILPVRPEALADSPGLATDRLQVVNQALLALCEEKGCYYIDLSAVFSDETGALPEDVAESDGIHIKKAAYSTWLEYLCTHVPYAKSNPYQPGTPYYLTDAIRSLLADIP